MESQPSQAPTNFSDSVSNIFQNVNEKDQNLMITEAYVKFSKLEVQKLEADTKAFNKKSEKLKDETEMFQKEIKLLDASIDISRKSLELKSKMLINSKQELSQLEADVKKSDEREQAAYKENMEEYKKARKVYETYHPLFKEVKHLQTENLKREVKLKMLRAQVLEKKKQIKQRREIHRQIFNATFVKFAKNTLQYWKDRDLTNQLNEGEKGQANLIQQLHDLEKLAAQKEKESKRTQTSYESSEIKNSKFMAEQSWNDINNDNVNFVTPSLPIYPSAYSRSFNPLDTNLSKSDEMLLQIRARCDERQQQWEKQHSFSSNNRKVSRSVPNKYPQMPNPQKRPLQPTNTPSSQFKISKNIPDYNVVRKENFPFINEQTLKVTTPVQSGNQNSVQNSNVNIISVQNIKPNKKQPLIPQGINKNYHPAMEQLTPHSLAKQSQNYSSENNPPQIRSQKTNKSVLTPSNVTVGTPKQFQGYYPEEMKQGSVNIKATQYIPPTPVQCRSENIAITQSQPSISQQLIQNISSNETSFVDPYSMSQSNRTQNVTQMLLSGNQAVLAQGSSKSGNNTTMGTSQSSTFSQKCLEFRHFLDRETQDTSYAPPSAPQNIPMELGLTSPFFNKSQPGEPNKIVTQPQENITEQEMLAESESGLIMDQYYDTSMYYDDEENPNISFDDIPPPSPAYEENNTESQAQPAPTVAPTGFSFNFAQAQTTQGAEKKWIFSNNPAPTKSFFNMF